MRKDGSRFWANVVIDADPRRRRRADRLRQDHARHHRAAGRRRSRCAKASAQFRLLVERRDRLRALHARSATASSQLERRRASASRATPPTRSSASTSRASTPRTIAQPACRRGRCRRPRREGRFEAEGWRVRKDGTLFWANVVIDPIRDEDGELIGFAKITRDITERRERRSIALQKAQRAARPVAEDGSARPAHRRRRARLQQSADGRQRRISRRSSAVRGRIRKARARSRRSSMRGAARRQALTRQLLTFSRRQTLNPVAVTIAERARGIAHHARAARLGASVEARHARSPADIWPVHGRCRTNSSWRWSTWSINARDAMPQGRRDHAHAPTTSSLPARRHRRSSEGELRRDLASPTPAPASRPTSSARCSIRSSPPSSQARARASASRRCTASRTNRAARSASAVSSATARR